MKKYLGGIFSLVLVSLLFLSPVHGAELFNKDIRYGVYRNSDITRLQTFLRDEGYYTGPITGNFLSLTKKALNIYQNDQNIPISSKLDESTRTTINNELLALEQSISPTIQDNSANFTTLYDSQGNGVPFYQDQIQMALNSGYSYFLNNNIITPTPGVINQPTQQQDQQTLTYQQPIQQTNTNVVPQTIQQTTNTQTTTNTNIVPTPIISNSVTSTTSTTNYELQTMICTNLGGSCNGTYTFTSTNPFLSTSLLSMVVNDQRAPNYIQANSQTTNFPINNSPVKLQSVSVRNLGTLDLKKTNLSFRFYSNSLDTTGNPRDKYNISPNSLTTSTASFSIPTWILDTTDAVTGLNTLYADINGQNIGDTVKMQFTNVQLENTDPTKNYTVKF